MKKRLFAVGLSVCMAFAIVGCSSSGSDSAKNKSTSASSSTSSPSESKSKSASSGSTTSNTDYKIAIVPMSLNDSYQILMANAAKAYCDEIGVNGTILTGSEDQADAQGQLELIENVITGGTYDGMVLAPVSIEEGTLAAEKLLDAGMAVCIMDSQINQDSLESAGYEKIPFVGTGNYDAAVSAGKWIRENYSEGVKMAKLNGADGQANGEARKTGLDEGLDGWANVVGEQSTDWTMDTAYQLAQNIIAANPDLELIWCASDLVAIGARSAVEEAGMQNQIDIMAFDGTVDGLELVVSEDFVADSAQYPDLMGQKAIDNVLKMLNGEDYELVTDTGSDIITKDSAQELIDRLEAYL